MVKSALNTGVSARSDFRHAGITLSWQRVCGAGGAARPGVRRAEGYGGPLYCSLMEVFTGRGRSGRHVARARSIRR